MSAHARTLWDSGGVKGSFGGRRVRPVMFVSDLPVANSLASQGLARPLKFTIGHDLPRVPGQYPAIGSGGSWHLRGDWSARDFDRGAHHIDGWTNFGGPPLDVVTLTSGCSGDALHRAAAGHAVPDGQPSLHLGDLLELRGLDVLAEGEAPPALRAPDTSRPRMAPQWWRIVLRMKAIS